MTCAGSARSTPRSPCPAGGTSVLPLEGVSASRYEGVRTAPPNTGDAPASTRSRSPRWTTSVSQGTVDAGQHHGGRAAPVVQGRLSLWPSTLSFALTPTGRRVSRTVVLRNPGRRVVTGDPGRASSRPAPFSLVGAGPQGVPFSLRGGELKIISVEYRPTSAGRHQGSVAVQRADGGQPGLALRLAGRGIRLRYDPPGRRRRGSPARRLRAGSAARPPCRRRATCGSRSGRSRAP